MAHDKITAKQQEILDFIKSEIINRGYPPSVRDICEAVHLKSTSSVHSHLESLEKKGFIRKDPTKPRAIEVLDEDFNTSRMDSLGFNQQEMTNIPVIGTVAAGTPILASQNVTNYVPLPLDMIPGKAQNPYFILNVKGDSMINCGIFSGDQIIVEQRSTASNGEIIVAMVDEEATVKRFFKEKDHIRLQPENDSMDPIIIPAGQQISILGKVVGLLRFNIV